MKKVGQVDHTILGTVWAIYLKSITFGFKNTALQHPKTEWH